MKDGEENDGGNYVFFYRDVEKIVRLNYRPIPAILLRKAINGWERFDAADRMIVFDRLFLR